MMIVTVDYIDFIDLFKSFQPQQGFVLLKKSTLTVAPVVTILTNSRRPNRKVNIVNIASIYCQYWVDVIKRCYD
jgi:hypothetical protein